MTKLDQRIAKHAVKKGWVKVKKAQECLRILAVRDDIGEASTLDRILFEMDLVSARQVQQLQRRLKFRIVFCPQCSARHDLFEKQPGARARCVSCRTRFRVPGVDPDQPFEVPQPKPRVSAEPQGAAGVSLGLLCVLAVGALFLGAGMSSSSLLPVACGGAVYVGLAVFLGRQKRLLAASGLGLAVFTALVIGAAVGNDPGAGAVAVLGVDAHRLVAPLVVAHLVVLTVVAVPILRRTQNPLPFLLLCVPLCYGVLFFLSRCLPGTDLHLVAGPTMFDNLPWYLHPGVVTLLALFPLASLYLLGAGSVRVVRRQPGTLLRDAGLVVGLLLLAVYGLTVGTLRDAIPAPGMRASLDSALAGHRADWLEPGTDQPEKATTAVASTEPAGPK